MNMLFIYEPHISQSPHLQKRREKNGYGEPFQAWEMWPSPHLEKPVGSEPRQAGPMPRDRFSREESGLHCT